MQKTFYFVNTGVACKGFDPHVFQESAWPNVDELLCECQDVAPRVFRKQRLPLSRKKVREMSMAAIDVENLGTCSFTDSR